LTPLPDFQEAAQLFGLADDAVQLGETGVNFFAL
jgi:hypothetical protein